MLERFWAKARIALIISLWWLIDVFTYSESNSSRESALGFGALSGSILFNSSHQAPTTGLLLKSAS